MTKLTKKELKRIGKGWSWECDFGLCFWATPTKNTLLLQSKPSPEAKEVFVRLVPVNIWRKLIGRKK